MSRESEVVEQGDIFFFYRPRVGAEEVSNIDDVQRFYMITASENADQYRLFILGRKQLPEIVEGKSTSEERNWALNTLTTKNPEDIRRELLAAEYETETRGKRRVAAAAPAGEGKYAIVKHDNHTELAYTLELPEIPGPTQKEFEIKKEARYVVSVKNPDITIPGFKAFEKRKPKYSSEIMEKFGNRRWISVDDPQLLNYENSQLLLIGAREKDVREELGIDLNEEKETADTAGLFKDLRIRKEQVPLKPILKGEFPSKGEQPMAGEVKHLPKEEAPGRGGKAGGMAAASRAPSAAAIARVLSGAEFPKQKQGLIEYAENNKSKVETAEQVIQVIRELPDKTYDNMADVERAVGEVR
ncbi:MAG TPA: DUF2795 domain-containing protein [Nitrososphaera sp.]|jgi:hypothetical protein